MNKLQILALSILVATGSTMHAGETKIVPPTIGSVTTALGGAPTLALLQAYATKFSTDLGALNASSTIANYIPVLQEAVNMKFSLGQLAVPTVTSVTTALGGAPTLTLLQAYVNQYIQSLGQLTASSTITDYQTVILEAININFALRQLLPPPPSK